MKDVLKALIALLALSILFTGIVSCSDDDDDDDGLRLVFSDTQSFGEDGEVQGYYAGYYAIDTYDNGTFTLKQVSQKSGPIEVARGKCSKQSVGYKLIVRKYWVGNGYTTVSNDNTSVVVQVSNGKISEDSWMKLISLVERLSE